MREELHRTEARWLRNWEGGHREIETHLVSGDDTRKNLGLNRPCRRSSDTHTHTQSHIQSHKHTRACTHVWTIKSHDVAFREPIEQSVCGQNASKGARMRFRSIVGDHRRRRRPITLPQDHEWKCKLMGVAPVPEVIRIEASAIDNDAAVFVPEDDIGAHRR